MLVKKDCNNFYCSDNSLSFATFLELLPALTIVRVVVFALLISNSFKVIGYYCIVLVVFSFPFLLDDVVIYLLMLDVLFLLPPLLAADPYLACFLPPLGEFYFCKYIAPRLFVFLSVDTVF
jgi:hypothetical protein